MKICFQKTMKCVKFLRQINDFHVNQVEMRGNYISKIAFFSYFREISGKFVDIKDDMKILYIKSSCGSYVYPKIIPLKCDLVRSLGYFIAKIHISGLFQG